MFLTLLVALLFGALLEVDGLYIWAERLGVGPLREQAVTATAAWKRWLQPLGLGVVRFSVLQAKAELAPLMLGSSTAVPLAEIDLASVGVLPVSVEAAQAPLVRVPMLVSPEAREDFEPELLVTRAPFLPATTQSMPVEAGAGLQVALAGDSMMAVGLAPALSRGLVADKGVRLLRAYRSGTGLARPEVYDWLQQYPQMLGSAQPQLVICALGANDGQNVQVGKKVLEFGSPEWDEFYRARLTAYLDMLLKQQARVLWVGMPVMKERRFAQKMLHMNALVRAELQRYPAVTWLDPNPTLGYADNAFAQYRANEHGKLIKMRADDGIHMTDEGAGYLLVPIRDWLVRTAPLARPLASATSMATPQRLGVPTTSVVEEELGKAF
ncbi:hypothetical protein GCM10027046_17930 [Uliginosibacterium flavum]|uniref:DUF459 domain-containing protein n=1 Tax=Uliginosibacterium flavum TaxID=1396831 RepID=A0ABV2TFC8_9RHOO